MNRIYILLHTLICLFFFTLSANGQEHSIVEANTLNVRSGPNKQGLVVHTLHKGDTVEVHQQVTTWSNITHQGHNGWVAQRYLRHLPAQSTVHSRQANDTEPWLDLHDTKVLYWCILILLGIPLYIVQQIWIKSHSRISFFWLFSAMLLATWTANIYYFSAVPRAIWFFKDPIWYKIAGNVLLYFGYICYLSAHSFFLLRYIAKLDDSEVNINTSTIGIIITSIIIYLLDWLLNIHIDLLNYLIIGFLIYQLYQIFKNLTFGYALLYLLVYSFSFGSLLVIAYQCIIPVLILAFFALSGSGSEDSSGSRSTSSSSRSDGSFYVDNGYGRSIRLTPRGSNEYKGDDGCWYRKDSTTGKYVIDE